MSSSLHVIPRLPALPDPPDFGPDPRQQVFRGVTSALSSATGNAVTVNLNRGFHASRVDVASLKSTLETGVREFTKATLLTRWENDVRDWMHSVLRSHVQRQKQRTLTCHDDGVHVRLETQDDFGYYVYEWDVFPGR